MDAQRDRARAETVPNDWSARFTTGALSAHVAPGDMESDATDRRAGLATTSQLDDARAGALESLMARPDAINQKDCCANWPRAESC